MAADAPTILATSGGMRAGRRVRWEFSPLTTHAVELACVTGRAPRVCGLFTAVGDDAGTIKSFYEAGNHSGYITSHLAVFPMPNVDDMREHLLAQDVIWVFGGSVAALLVLWRLHGLDEVLRECWQAGVVLTGSSAGSLCWHVGGTTDSFGPDLRPVTNGLALVPFSNGVHYDSEPQRRPLFESLIADETLPAGYATEDGTGVLYRGTRFAGAICEVPGKAIYFVSRTAADEVSEERLDPQLLRSPWRTDVGY
jgi:peptidase E